MVRQACINIYQQQYQMGRFVRQHYNNSPIALGDIGAVSFLSEGKKLDMEGLGDIEVARSRLNHYWSPAFANWLLRKDSVKIAIVYAKSYPAVMQNWTRVGSWQIPNNVVCYSSTVSFYAIDSSTAIGLKANLQAFERSLPGDIEVKYY